MILGGSSYNDKRGLEEVIESVEKLSNRKIGALIVWQRDANLDYYIDSGIPLDSQLSQELILTIFQPNTLLHDGAIIIRNGRIVAASCLLPLSKNPEWEKSLGTRHRAAIGLTEETDAVVTIVSEENGSTSLAVNGNIIRHLDIATLDRMLNELLVTNAKKSSGVGK
jgi:diadenylate cyclase